MQPQYAQLQVGNKIRTWVLDTYVSGTRQDPPAIGSTYDYVNNTEHTILDKWNGWVDVRLTNFDLNGDPSHPMWEIQPTDTTTGSNC